MTRPVHSGLRRPRRPPGTGIAAAGTIALHVAAGVALFGTAGMVHQLPPPTIEVNLVAAPAPQPNQRKAPEAVTRPAAQPTPALPKPKPQKKPAVKAPPPPPATPEKREAAPRTTPKVAPAPGEKPSTGSDVATVKTTGVEFPYPEYLRNIYSQILMRWQRPSGNVALRAEIFFLIHRDGSISDVQFTHRSGSFAFDLEAQGAIEAAGNANAFGPLPGAYSNDVLPVTFFFTPSGSQ